MATSADVQSSVAKLKAMGAQAVKVWYLAPQPARREELDARMMEVGAAAKVAGLDLTVHATGLREAKVAPRADAVLLVHSVEDRGGRSGATRAARGTQLDGRGEATAR